MVSSDIDHGATKEIVLYTYRIVEDDALYCTQRLPHKSPI